MALDGCGGSGRPVTTQLRGVGALRSGPATPRHEGKFARGSCASWSCARYLEKIKGNCDWIEGAFTKRGEARKQESEGLQQAKAILAGSEGGESAAGEGSYSQRKAESHHWLARPSSIHFAPWFFIPSSNVMR